MNLEKPKRPTIWNGGSSRYLSSSMPWWWWCIDFATVEDAFFSWCCCHQNPPFVKAKLTLRFRDLYYHHQKLARYSQPPTQVAWILNWGYRRNFRRNRDVYIPLTCGSGGINRVEWSHACISNTWHNSQPRSKEYNSFLKSKLEYNSLFLIFFSFFL